MNSEMSDSEISMRKFLKQLGVTGHQKLLEALEDAVRSGTLQSGSDVPVTARIEIEGLEFSHVITATLQAPELDG